MSLYKRKNVWWISFTTPDGTRVRCSAQTDEKTKALEFHDTLKAQYWRSAKLKEKPQRLWQQAVIRWLKETAHKASTEDDKRALRWTDTYLREYSLDKVDRDIIDHLTTERLSEGVSNATVNRMLEVVRAILRKAEREWGWIERAPYVRMLPEPKRRVRWLTREEVNVLLDTLPKHLVPLVIFSLSTGLRKSNVTGLEWSQVDLGRHLAWIHADQAKAGRSISVPLNEDACSVIRDQIGRHERYVFTYSGNPIKEANTKAWRAALKRAGISNFRWHDLRHTWASWHVQQGTPLAVLQELGGWESSEMVRRYAHFGNEHTARYADQLSLQLDPQRGSFGTNLAHCVSNER